MYRGGPTTKTSVRLANAILTEFGKDDGLAMLEWLGDLLQAAEKTPVAIGLHRKKEKRNGH